jgi:uncharacterized protein YydD (DUF2326 family)
LDEEIARLEARQTEQQALVQYTEDQLSQIVARIEHLAQQVSEAEESIDNFSFDTEERRMMDDLVGEIESQTSEVNERLYNIRYDLLQIYKALERKDKFDLAEIESVFSDASLHFPGQLKRNYEELVAFNRQVTHERNVALRARRKTLEEEQGVLLGRKSDLDSRRERHLKVLRNHETFEKFKALQRELTEQKSQLFYLEQQREKLEAVAVTAREVREVERDRGRVVEDL